MIGSWTAEDATEEAERRKTQDGGRDADEIVHCIAFCFVASALVGLVCAACLVPFALL